MKLALQLLIAGAAVDGLQLPRMKNGVHIIKTTEDVLDTLPRMKRDSDVFDYDADDSEVAGDISSPEMSPDRIRESEAVYNGYLAKEKSDETPFKPMDGFISAIFDNARDDPVPVPGEDGAESVLGSRVKANARFENYIAQNPSGISPAKFPSNLLSDLYDPVYEEGPLLCRKTRAMGAKGIGNGEQPVHVKPIGCCPNNEDGKPFGPGKACCCGTVYNTTSHFCCDQSRGECRDGSYSSIILIRYPILFFYNFVSTLIFR